MPLKDVSKEEQSNLYLSGCCKKEAVKLTETDKVNMGGKLPLTYYNIINEDVTRKEETKDKDYGNIPGLYQEVPNPNALNRPLAWPIRVRSSISSEVQEEIIEVIITSLERFHWENTEISHFVKKELDRRFGCSWHVVVGEEFGFDITHEIGGMMYIFYGSLGVLLWKCGTQLLSEVKYKPLNEEDDIKKKGLNKGGEKYTTIIY